MRTGTVCDDVCVEYQRGNCETTRAKEECRFVSGKTHEHDDTSRTAGRKDCDGTAAQAGKGPTDATVGARRTCGVVHGNEFDFVLDAHCRIAGASDL